MANGKTIEGDFIVGADGIHVSARELPVTFQHFTHAADCSNALNSQNFDL